MTDFTLHKRTFTTIFEKNSENGSVRVIITEAAPDTGAWSVTDICEFDPSSINSWVTYFETFVTEKSDIKIQGMKEIDFGKVRTSKGWIKKAAAIAAAI
jgi:hypothetical protein